MLTTSLIALPWYRPSVDLLSLHSRPASTGSRIYFTIVLCFEIFVSKPAHSLFSHSQSGLSTGIHILIPHPSTSSGASRTPDRLFLFPCQHPKHEHLFAAVPYTPSALHDDNHQRDQRTNTILFALTRAGPRLYHIRSTNTRQPLPLFRANPIAHMARVRTRLRPPISQTSHLPPIVVFAAAVSTIGTLPRVRVHVSITRRRNAFAGRRRR
jgi:hypothetical protein